MEIDNQNAFNIGAIFMMWRQVIIENEKFLGRKPTGIKMHIRKSTDVMQDGKAALLIGVNKHENEPAQDWLLLGFIAPDDFNDCAATQIEAMRKFSKYYVNDSVVIEQETITNHTPLTN